MAKWWNTGDNDGTLGIMMEYGHQDMLQTLKCTTTPNEFSIYYFVLDKNCSIPTPKRSVAF